MNRVLTLEEIMALADGSVVFGEVNQCVDKSGSLSGVYERRGECFVQQGQRFPMVLGINMPGRKKGYWRVWSLPVAPTPDELAAWPWEA